MRTPFPPRAVVALILFAALGGLIQCSSFGDRRVRIQSAPEGAEVLTVGGKSLGKTPLVLQGEKLNEAVKDNRLDVLVRAPRFVERQMTLDLQGDDAHEVRLVPLDQTYFAQRFMEDFGAQANELARRLMTAQGLAFAGKLEESEKELSEIESRFPNLAPIFVLRADIERLRGNPDKARGYLLRAKSLDPRDPVATRLLATDKEKEKE